ncbi:MAG: glycoside hydrolase family 3 protein [Bacteroidales bacterium]|nr:glycoside hydrolase family 3 protein [Bacteroidales bacterium]
MKRYISTVAAILASLLCLAQNKTPRLGESNIDEIIQELTLREKACLVVGSGLGNMLDIRMMSSEPVKVSGAAGTTRSVERLGIPSIVLSDGPAGVRIKPGRKNHFCTGFPVGSLLACSWDTETVEAVGAAMGNEALEYGVDVILAPGMNLMRNPLCGRNFEYYSEDPYLSGKIASAFVRGVQSQGVGTSVKHFAVNSQETNRLGNNAIVDEETLRELYLKGFEIVVKEAQPWTVMSSYNKLNGEYTQESRWLLTEVLREEWGFEGLVVSDWTFMRNTVAQIAAGNDLLEPGLKKQINQIVRKVRKGELDESQLDICVRRVLELVVKTPTFKNYEYSNAPDLKVHAAVARTAASDGMVLLENRDALPMEEVRNIALFGCASYELIPGGTGSGNVNRPYVVNLSDGLVNAGYRLDGQLSSIYKKYMSKKSNRRKGYVMVGQSAWSEMSVDVETVRSAAASDDMAILTLSRQAGEGQDRAVEDDFKLNPTEHQLIEDVCREFHAVGKKVVVVLNVGGVIETASWKHLPDAVLLAWQPGQEGGNAIVDVLSGKVNPSGRLSMTWPLDYSDVPSSADFPAGETTNSAAVSTAMLGGSKDKGRRNIDYTEYREGLNVGYRYFGLEGLNVSYPFGYGLSYTTFSQELSSAADGSKAVRVTNTGSIPGREVVMLYEEGILVSFGKTRLLAPGESQIVRLL